MPFCESCTQKQHTCEGCGEKFAEKPPARWLPKEGENFWYAYAGSGEVSVIKGERLGSYDEDYALCFPNRELAEAAAVRVREALGG